MHSHSSGAAILGDNGESTMDTCLLCTPSPVITEALQILHICIGLQNFQQAPVIPNSLPHLRSPIRIVQIFPLVAFWSFHGSRDLVHKSCWPCWGVGGSERTGMTEKHRNSICNVFLQACFYFLCAKAAITDQLLPNSQFKKLWLWMKALAAEFDHIPQLHQREKGGRVNSEPDSLRWFNMGAGPKYIVLGLCWWMDHQIHLIVCSKT